MKTKAFTPFLFLFFMGVIMVSGLAHAVSNSSETSETSKPNDKSLAAAVKELSATADHSKFEILNQKFKSGPEVTKACLTCHTEASKQVMKSNHWHWEFKHPKTGQKLGKRHVINSFCGNVVSNEPRCTSCHAGYDWKDMRKAPPREEAKVDCLVCHDTTGSYSKTPTGAGHPLYSPKKKNGKTILPPDLTMVAKNVGLPKRENCGSCHYYGGGGDNVKHGDLSSALNKPSKHVDVHMAADGANFQCTTCHATESHKWAGSRYDVQVVDKKGMRNHGQRRDVATCESCHGMAPHKTTSLQGVKLNNHTDKIACQTCHIPEYAKGGVATKMKWDWSEAGQDNRHDKDYIQGDGKALHAYLKTKGSFEYGENVKPHYAWFNGQVKYNLIDMKIDPTKPVNVNEIKGSATDGQSRIWPFKKMKGKQPYDKKNKTLVYTHVWGPKTDTAYWTNFDWKKSITHAMKKADKPFSGEHGFVSTNMYWPITHMVAPKEEALDCQSCHAKNGRLSSIKDLYIPGQTRFKWLDFFGFLALGAALAGVLFHGFLRFVAARWPR